MTGPDLNSESDVEGGAEPISSNRTVIFVLIFGQLAVGSAAIMAKYGLQSGVSALGLSAWRLTRASAILLTFTAISSRQSLAPRVSFSTKFWLVVAGVFLGLHFYTWFESLNYISVARSTLLVSTAPIWTGMYAVLIQLSRLGIPFWIGITGSMVGMFLLTHVAEISRFPRDPMVGDCLALVGAIAIAAYLIVVEKVGIAIKTNYIVVWTYSSAALFLMALNIMFSHTGTLLPGSRQAWLSVIGLALLPQLVGHTTLNWCLRHLGSATVAASSLLEPVFAAILAFAFFGERLTGVQILGGIILLIGISVSLRGRERET